MKICDKCEISVRTDQETCPLCQGPLSGEAEPAAYPDMRTEFKRSAYVYKIVLFACVSISLLSLMLNVLLPKGGWWSRYVVFGLACLYLCVQTAMNKRHNIPKTITNETLFVIVLSVVWDLIVGWHGWSIDYAIPITCIVAMASMAIVAQVMHIPASDYVFWLGINILFGIVPLAFWLFGLTDILLPTLFCITLSVISLAAVIIFHGGDIWQEMVKRLHI